MAQNADGERRRVLHPREHGGSLQMEAASEPVCVCFLMPSRIGLIYGDIFIYTQACTPGSFFFYYIYFGRCCGPHGAIALHLYIFTDRIICM